MGAVTGLFANRKESALHNEVARMYAPLNARDSAPPAFLYSPGVLLAAAGAQNALQDAEKGVLIALDGELYNRAELKDALKDVPPMRETDCSLILRAYQKWGADFPSRLLGAFAIALWDENKQTLILTRDHMGAKPLFYAQLYGTVAFSSELKGLLKAPHMRARLEPEGLCSLFALGPARAPHESIFAGTHSLAPGHTVHCTKKHLLVSRYWNPIAMVNRSSVETISRDLLTLVRDSVHRMPTQAALLSGGLDSSLICALIKESQLDLTTFSVEYQGDDTFTPNDYQPGDDRPYVTEMVQALECVHHRVLLSQEELADTLLEAMRARDLPGMADIDSSLLLLLRAVRQAGFDTVLSGECADEILGGYPWYYREDLFALKTFPWSHNYSIRQNVLKKELEEWLDLKGYADQHYQACVENVPIPDPSDEEDAHRRQLYALCRSYFMQTLLERGDRMGSRAGVQVRMPFCDHRLAEYAQNIPWSVLAYQDREKGALRHGAEGLLPQSVLWRKKSPYPKTRNAQFSKRVAELMANVLAEKDAPIHALINKPAIEELIQHPQTDAPPWYGQLMGVPQILGMLYQLNGWLKEYNVDLPL